MNFKITDYDDPIAETEWMICFDIEFQIKAIRDHYCVYWKLPEAVINWLKSKVSDIEDDQEVEAYIDTIIDMHGGCTYWDETENVIGCDFLHLCDKPISDEEYFEIFGTYGKSTYNQMFKGGRIQQTYESVLTHAKEVCAKLATIKF